MFKKVMDVVISWVFPPKKVTLVLYVHEEDYSKALAFRAIAQGA